MRKIRKRHSAELEHQSGNLLSTPQVLRLGCFIKKCMQFLYGHCLFLPDIHTNPNAVSTQVIQSLSSPATCARNGSM